MVVRKRRTWIEELESRRMLSAHAMRIVRMQPAHAPGVGLAAMAARAIGVEHPTFKFHLSAGQLTPFSTSGPTGLTPTQIRHAYGFDQVSGDGTGETIAIIDAYNDPNIVSDLHAFDQHFGIPDPPSISVVNQNGGSSLPATDPAGAGNANGTWEVEESLDVEWAHALAPGAKILLVEATTPDDPNLIQAAVSYARGASGVAVVSMSFGESESAGDGFDQYFTTPSGHTGVTFLASTGDNGSPAGYPSYSPNVVAVGGTTLSVDGSGNYQGETVWNDLSTNEGATGGGISTVESQPSYQNGVVSQFSTTNRTAPDVAFDADPNSGVPVYDSWDFGTSSPWLQVGGTSFSSPSWAAIIAIVDQARASAGESAMDGATYTLPKLYSLPQSDFNDVTSGNNGTYSAGVGYDLVTGRGTPKVASVVNDLVGAYTVASSSPASGSTIYSATAPTSFSVTFAAAYSTTGLSASVFTVNGVAANSYTQTSSTTLTFNYNNSPVTTPGVQTMAIAAGAITRASDGAPVAAFNASFRYGVTQLAVASTTPANNSSALAPLTSLTVHFNEAFATSSIATSNLTMSQGSVTGTAIVDSQTVTYSLSGVTSGGTFTFNIAAGTITDTYGNGGAAYSGSLTLTKAPVAFPTPLAADNPPGSLIYQNSTTGTITSGSSDVYTLAIAAGQTLSLLVTPSSGLQAQISVSGPGVSTSASSASAGADAVLQTVMIATAGTYTFTVSGLNSTTGTYTLKAVLNAALSTATVGGAAIHSLATGQNINSSFTALTGTAQRGAALGTLSSLLGPDSFGYTGASVASQFVDISSTGTSLFAVGTDDANVQLTTTNLNGFTFKFYGTTYNTLYVSSNGLITFGSGNNAYRSRQLNSSQAPSQATIAAYWDDLVVTGGTNSGVFAELVGSGNSEQLVVQWNQCSVYGGNQTGQVTVEAILNANGTIQFNDSSLNTGDSHANGATASVGIKAAGTSGESFLQVAYHTTTSPYVAAGSGVLLGVGLGASDYYAFSVAAGQSVTLGVANVSSGNLTLALQNASGTVLATGASPGSGATVAVSINNYVVSTAGTYYAVIGGAGGTSYSLVVDRGADFASGLNTTFAAAQNISTPLAVVGELPSSSTQPQAEWYSLSLAAGSGLMLQTSTFGDGSSQFVDSLSPQIQLYNSSDALIASGQGSGGNQTLRQAISAAGAYYVRVFETNSSSGEYLLTAAIDAATPTVAISNITPNTRNSPLSQIQFVFNKPVSGVSLSQLSLSLNGGPNLLTSAQTLTTTDNTTYTLGNLTPLTGANGTYTLSLPSTSGITDSSGFALSSGASASFIVNTTPPEVTAVYVKGSAWTVSYLNYLAANGMGDATLGYRLNGGASQLTPLPWTNIDTISVAFSQDVTVNTAQAGLALSGSPDVPAPAALSSAAFSYNSTTHVATWAFAAPLGDNLYLLKIPSAAVSNTLGTALDGEFTNANGNSPGGTFPSGNGTAGGDFSFRFNLLPGNAMQNGIVTGADGNGVRVRQSPDTTGPNYSAMFDLLGAGVINAADMTAVRSNLLASLPVTPPS